MGWFSLVCLLALVVLVRFGPDPERTVPSVRPCERFPGQEPVPQRNPGVFRTMRRHRAVLLRVGGAAAALAAVRSARQILLPLWGVSLQLDAQSIAVVVGLLGCAFDFALFYASGQVMDRFGRLWAVLPALGLASGGFVVLAGTHALPQASLWFAAIAAVLGIGNGLSSGILATIGADLAPQDAPAAFPGSWRTIGDAGGAAAPLLVSVISALASPPVALRSACSARWGLSPSCAGYRAIRSGAKRLRRRGPDEGPRRLSPGSPPQDRRHPRRSCRRST